ncbi:glutathione S-transferase family protein [Lacibacterium aquatile]|uniref:Glutathione S-transferase family protein n=1 Tax=Lacibacterium aquatile TaxID=1168082 RepID=A0ABW5DS52_9PROT
MLTIWGRKSSSNVQALMWAVGELGLPYKRLDIGHRYGGNNTPKFLGMNPNGTIPVLRDGEDEPLWETGAILRYLATRYAPESFWPADPARRAQIDKWAEWAKINVCASFTEPVFWRVVRTAPSKQDPVAIAQAVAKLDRILDIAEVRLTDVPFLAGADFSLADIQFGHILYRYFDIAIARPSRPALQRYYEALTRRPAFADHVMVSYEELRVLD